jgi:excisionase family DNA binding protein
MALVTLAEAAHRLGVSVDTVRRRLQRGELRGQQQARPQGYVWLIELENNTEHNSSADRPAGAEQGSQGCVAGCQTEINRLEQMVAMLQDRVTAQDTELAARRKEVSELHVLLQELQRSLPAPMERRSWWKWWLR